MAHTYSQVFLVALYTGGGGLYTERLLCLEFFTPVICICISRNRNEINYDKKQCSCSKMPLYYLTANKTRDAFHNSEPLALLRFKNASGGALISVELLRLTLF